MKKLILLSAILAFSASSFAQTEPASGNSSSSGDSERLRFGIKAGYVLSNIRISGDSYSSIAIASQTKVEHGNGFM